ncbi:MAG TPA: HmuY family protein, partial [Thermodesulfobacteriota bacterium]|nr:HmuY family protein [Thermodesulfobacteriota bacterium]
MKILKSFLPLCFVIILSFGLMGGCGGGGGSSGNDGGGGGGGGGSNDPFTTVLVDATAGGLSAPADDPANKFSYLDLSTGEVLPFTDSQAKSSTDWDIAFKRSTVILNGGISGPGDVTGYFTGNNSEAYDGNGDPILDWFSSATADSELPDFNAVTSDDIPLDDEGNPDSSAFTSDSPLLAVTGDGTSDGWWLYDFETHTVSANDASWWVVRSDAGDSYAKFHVTEILLEGSPEEWVITLDLDIQAAGDTGFTATDTYTAHIPFSGGSVYLDFDTLSEVGSGGGWDLRI